MWLHLSLILPFMVALHYVGRGHFLLLLLACGWFNRNMLLLLLLLLLLYGWKGKADEVWM